MRSRRGSGYDVRPGTHIRSGISQPTCECRADREGRWPAACGTRKPRFSDSDTCEVCCSQRQSFRELLEVLCFDACFDPQRKALSVRVVLHPDLLTLAERPQLSPS